MTTTTLALAVQVAVKMPNLPTEAQLRQWCQAAFSEANYTSSSELVIRIVDEAEGADLNQRYRHKPRATNVLSFPFQEDFAETTLDLLGDVVICAPIVFREAKLQHKEPQAHWAHLVIHGVLHLLGYDHQTDSQADIMEKLEIRILKGLGYPDPYGELIEA
jgi:probable rRNA maturation factor